MKSIFFRTRHLRPNTEKKNTFPNLSHKKIAISYETEKSHLLQKYYLLFRFVAI
jgi:hypothetical protein